MTTKGKEIVIDGEPFVDSRAVYELFNGLVSDDAIRDLGKGWGRQKIGNRYFYRKADVKLPNFPIARWQRMTLMYLSLIMPDYPAMEFAEGGYYYALSFLNGAKVEKIVTGDLIRKAGKTAFVLVFIAGKVNRYHLIVMDDTLIAGRKLRDDEVAAVIATAHRSTGADIQVWNPSFFEEIANELLTPAEAQL